MARKANPLIGAAADDRPRIHMRENNGSIEWKRAAAAPWNRGCSNMYDALCLGTEDANGQERADYPAVIIWEGSTDPR